MFCAFYRWLLSVCSVWCERHLKNWPSQHCHRGELHEPTSAPIGSVLHSIHNCLPENPAGTHRKQPLKRKWSKSWHQERAEPEDSSFILKRLEMCFIVQILIRHLEWLERKYSIQSNVPVPSWLITQSGRSQNTTINISFSCHNVIKLNYCWFLTLREDKMKINDEWPAMKCSFTYIISGVNTPLSLTCPGWAKFIIRKSLHTSIPKAPSTVRYCPFKWKGEISRWCSFCGFSPDISWRSSVVCTSSLCLYLLLQRLCTLLMRWLMVSWGSLADSD